MRGIRPGPARGLALSLGAHGGRGAPLSWKDSDPHSVLGKEGARGYISGCGKGVAEGVCRMV